MKIAIQGHSTRGCEVIQILENLGGENRYDQSGSNERFVYFINNIGFIYSVTPQMCSNERRIYTLEEFEKEFPFKVGDEVKDCSDGEVGIITDLLFIDNMLMYNVDFVNSGQAFMPTEQLKFHKEMKEERNITLTLDKAKEWYKKGGELREIALQAFSEKELNPLPRSWEEFAKSTKFDFHAQLHYTCGVKNIINGCLLNKSIGESSNIWNKYVALFQLEQLRNCWWNGWEPEWNFCDKYAIKNDKNKLHIIVAYSVSAFLVFPTREMAEEFLECFRDLIEKAGDLI